MAYIYQTDRLELRKQIKELAGLFRGQLLDIGAGEFSRYQDLFSVETYIKMNRQTGPNTDVVGQIEQIPFPEASFDSIVCTQVLGDVYDLPRAFHEIYRVLRPNGLALITEDFLNPLHDEPTDYWRFTRHSLKQLAETAGLEIVVLQSRGGYHQVMAQLKNRYRLERWQIGRRWFARLYSFFAKVQGTLARLGDHLDRSRANKLFAHGYLLIIKKHA